MEIISFNSYKGGSCRTTTCYNAIPFLARNLNATSKNPIIVFDCDLDSMGLTNLLFPRRRDEDIPEYSSRNLFCDENSNEIEIIENGVLNEPYFNKYQKVGIKFGLSDDGAVLFLGVNKNDSTISDEQFAKFKDNPPINKLVTALKRMDPDLRPKALVFDCASGVQMTTVAVLSVVEKIVMCMRPTSQAREGTFMYLKDKLPSILSRSYGKNRKVYLLLTSVPLINVAESEPNREEAIASLKKIRRKALDLIDEDLIEQIHGMANRLNLHYELIDDFADIDADVIGIPEVERFKWEECLLYKEDVLFTHQEELLKERYAELASKLAGK